MTASAGPRTCNTDLLGQMNRIYGRNPERAPVGKFDGDVGFHR